MRVLFSLSSRCSTSKNKFFLKRIYLLSAAMRAIMLLFFLSLSSLISLIQILLLQQLWYLREPTKGRTFGKIGVKIKKECCQRIEKKPCCSWRRRSQEAFNSTLYLFSFSNLPFSGGALRADEDVSLRH